MPYTTRRSRPTAYRDAGFGVSPYVRRPIVLSTGRGDTKVTPAEAVALARDLIAAATGTTPHDDPAGWLLRMAERVCQQSEILQANAGRK